MSDPVTTIKFITEQEYETLRGRIGSLELLMAQAWVAVLKATPDEFRDGVVEGALIQQEDRFNRLHPIAQRAALENAENILSSALATVRQPGAEG